MIKKIIDSYGIDNKLDDQMVINHFFDNNKLFFKKYVNIDTNKLIFANMSNIRSIDYLLNKSKSNYVIDYKKNKIINKNNNISPSIISGCGNFDMSLYVIFLGYSKKLIIKRNYNIFMINNIIRYFTTYFKIKN